MLLVARSENSTWVKQSHMPATIGRLVFCTNSRCEPYTPSQTIYVKCRGWTVWHFLRLFQLVINWSWVIYYKRPVKLVSKDQICDQDWLLNTFIYYLHQYLYPYGAQTKLENFVSGYTFIKYPEKECSLKTLVFSVTKRSGEEMMNNIMFLPCLNTMVR